MGIFRDDYCPDLFDFEDHGEDLPGVTCRRCGEERLECLNDGTRWRLVDPLGEIHQCPGTVANPDEFEDMSQQSKGIITMDAPRKQRKKPAPYHRPTQGQRFKLVEWVKENIEMLSKVETVRRHDLATKALGFEVGQVAFSSTVAAAEIDLPVVMRPRKRKATPTVHNTINTMVAAIMELYAIAGRPVPAEVHDLLN
jgi:hypothetical protein